MKHFFSLSLGMAALAGSAQFGTAPDFNVTDLDGNTHQLYADILDQGLIAVIDVCHVVRSLLEPPQFSRVAGIARSVRPRRHQPAARDVLRGRRIHHPGRHHGHRLGHVGRLDRRRDLPHCQREPALLGHEHLGTTWFPDGECDSSFDYEIVLDTYNLYSLEEQVDAINGADIDGIVLGVANTGDLARVAETLTCIPTLRTASLRWP